jgi:hypothetical protein
MDSKIVLVLLILICHSRVSRCQKAEKESIVDVFNTFLGVQNKLSERNYLSDTVSSFSFLDMNDLPEDIYISGNEYFVLSKDSIYSNEIRKIEMLKYGVDIEFDVYYSDKYIFLTGVDKKTSNKKSLNGFFVVIPQCKKIYFIATTYVYSLKILANKEVDDIIGIVELDENLIPLNHFRVLNGNLLTKGEFVYNELLVSETFEMVIEKNLINIKNISLLDLEEQFDKEYMYKYLASTLYIVKPYSPIWLCYPCRTMAIAPACDGL